MSSAGAYLFDVVRSPRGKARADGGLAPLKPQELVRQLCASLDTRLDDEACARAETLLLGCVGQIGAQGGNIALVSKLHSGLPDTASAYTLNNYCVSALTAIGQAASMVNSGQVRNALAGGVEMMSRVPFMADAADYYTDATMPARSRYVPVVLAADRLAEDEGIDRSALDAMALRSQQRAAAAETNATLTRSRIPMTRPDGTAMAVEECIRPQTSAASLAAMQPAFAELAKSYAAALGRAIDHRHTIAHAPPICDGASLALVGAKTSSRRPRARIVAYAECGGDPYASLLAGMDAMDRVLQHAGMQLHDVDCIEFMEAFAVTIAKFLRDRGVDPERVNVAGGHLAKGHPMGASGGILLSTLLDVLEARDATTGLVVASGASGVGAAMLVERC
ncbi:MAG TPA: acetyl-CoA C-acyltransferase [Steroidobacteraceae bacterium]|jgi:acetyl-CoA C-acetyltransferase/acetyl-CoA acyltransferase|nr:acetyl-CoA C-acyltransferase [Steroidobacteraceae bacterium]